MENNLKNLIWEWLLTFSQKKSLFSSKRIERFLSFTTVILLTIGYFIYRIKRPDTEFTASEFLMIISVPGAYAGWNTYQLFKDKKHDEKSIDTAGDSNTDK